jgi:hypothetical protein
MPTFTTKKSSPSRDRLAECHAAKAEAEAKVATIRSSIERLAGHEAEVAAAEQALARIDAEESQATLAWAKSGAGDAPTPDVDRRDEIDRALAVARSQAKAAAAARASLTAELEAATRPLHDIEAWTKVAIPLIVMEEAEGLMADLRETMLQMVSQKNRLDQISTLVLVHAEAAKEAKNPGTGEIYVAQEAFRQDLQLASALPPAPLDDSAASHEALMRFVADLRSDAAVALEVAP